MSKSKPKPIKIILVDQETREGVDLLVSVGQVNGDDGKITLNPGVPDWNKDPQGFSEWLKNITDVMNRS